MAQTIDALAQLLGTLEPELHDGVYVFAQIANTANISELTPVAVFHEAEGTTLILSEAEAQQAELPVLFRAAWISLTVYSDLQSVGLSAAVAGALAEAEISCNIVAAVHHDHLFVPEHQGRKALECLQALQQQANRAAQADNG